VPLHTRSHLSISQKGEKHDEANFDAIDVNDAMLGFHVAELNRVRQDPYFPRALYGGPHVGMNLTPNSRRYVSIRQAQVRKVANHKEGAVHGRK